MFVRGKRPFLDDSLQIWQLLTAKNVTSEDKESQSPAIPDRNFTEEATQNELGK
jgi:hypothetical protein